MVDEPMKIRSFREEDRDQVNVLLRSELWDDLPKRLGGHGLVAVVGEKVIGFCWSLVSNDSEIAYIESFIVDKNHRGVASVVLMQRMLFDLLMRGKTRVTGSISRGGEHSETLAKYYQHVGGMKVSLGYFFTGALKDVAERVFKFRRKAA
jgi:hypothetical protein